MLARFGTIDALMRFPAAALLIAIALVSTADAQRKGRGKASGPRPPEVAVVSMKIEREPRVVTVEGVVRNNSERTLRGLTLYFAFLEPGGATITRKNILVSSKEMEPGQEEAFLGQTVDPVRAVWVRVEAADKGGEELVVDKPGPYTIE